MDNALVIDGILLLLLAAGAAIGAWRGLYKSLMGFLVVLLAMVGSVLLAGFLTDPITDWAAPRVEEMAVEKFASALEAASGTDRETAEKGLEELTGILAQYGLDAQALDRYLGPLLGQFSEMLGDAKSTLQDKATEDFRDSVSVMIRELVRGTVHTVLVTVSYIVLLGVLRIFVRVTDKAFDLPGLNTLNTVGGALLGALEALLLLYVVLVPAAAIGFGPVAEHAEDTVLLSKLLQYSPVNLLSALLSGILSQSA